MAMKCKCMQHPVIVLSVIMTAALMFALHYIPLIADDFAVVKQDSVYYKVFHHGWPLRYVTYGPYADTGSTIALRIGTNFLVVGAFTYAVGLIAVRMIKKCRKHHLH